MLKNSRIDKITTHVILYRQMKENTYYSLLCEEMLESKNGHKTLVSIVK